MNDKDFLLWLATRLVRVYGENQGIDFVCKLVSIAAATPPDQRTPNTKTYANELHKGRTAVIYNTHSEDWPPSWQKFLAAFVVIVFAIAVILASK